MFYYSKALTNMCVFHCMEYQYLSAYHCITSYLADGEAPDTPRGKRMTAMQINLYAYIIRAGSYLDLGDITLNMDSIRL